VGVETGRNQDQLGSEGIERRHPALVHHLADHVAPGARRQRHIDHVFRRMVGTGVRVERMLEEAAHQGAMIVGQDLLGAVAMVHIEVDHRHPREPVHRQRMARRHGNVVEETETHRVGRPRMVTGRAHRAERVSERPAHHLVDRLEHRPGRAQCGVPGRWVHRRVGIDGDIAVLWCSGTELLDVPSIMRARQRLERSRRRLDVHEVMQQPDRNQVVLDRRQPCRRLRMPGAHLVRQTRAVRDESSVHACLPSAFGPSARAISSGRQPLPLSTSV